METPFNWTLFFNFSYSYIEGSITRYEKPRSFFYKWQTIGSMHRGHFDKNIRRYRDLCDADADSYIYWRQLIPQLPRLQRNDRNRPDLIDPK